MEKKLVSYIILSEKHKNKEKIHIIDMKDRNDEEWKKQQCFSVVVVVLPPIEDRSGRDARHVGAQRHRVQNANSKKTIWGRLQRGKTTNLSP